MRDPVELRVSILRQSLHNLYRFNRFFVVRLEGNRVPELRGAVTTALSPADQIEAAGSAERLDVYAMAALGGYHLFSIMQGHAFEGIEEDEFLHSLAEMIASRRHRTPPPNPTGRSPSRLIRRDRDGTQRVSDAGSSTSGSRLKSTIPVPALTRNSGDTSLISGRRPFAHQAKVCNNILRYAPSVNLGAYNWSLYVAPLSNNGGQARGGQLHSQRSFRHSMVFSEPQAMTTSSSRATNRVSGIDSFPAPGTGMPLQDDIVIARQRWPDWLYVATV